MSAYAAPDERSNCHSFLPYGQIFGYFSLPRNRIFCVLNDGSTVVYKTDGYGGRVFGSGGPDRVVVFGESQALGMDSNELPLVYRQLHATNAVLYATPNSGPLQNLARVKHGAFQKARRYVVIFNFGFDVFRLLPGWDSRKVNSQSIYEAEDLIESPRLFALKSLWRGLWGEAVGLSGDNNAEMKAYFLRKKPKIEKALAIYLERILPEFTQQLGADSSTTLLVYPPYWDPQLKEPEIAAVYTQFVGDLRKKPGVEVRVVEFPRYFDAASMLRGDKRHFVWSTPLKN